MIATKSLLDFMVSDGVIGPALPSVTARNCKQNESSASGRHCEPDYPRLSAIRNCLRFAPLSPLADLPTVEADKPFDALAAAEKLAKQGPLRSEIGVTFWVRLADRRGQRAAHAEREKRRKSYVGGGPQNSNADFSRRASASDKRTSNKALVSLGSHFPRKEVSRGS